MRNLKRVLSLTLASVMLLGMMVVGSSAAGYSDVDENDNVEAIEVLQAVEVMVGDDRGFGPDRPVTRNEMAVVMGKLLNLDYNYYTSTCPFNDVANWARGWVGACYANGIVSGRGNGIYDGESTVTAIEAASMMMRALGYFKNIEDYADGFATVTVRQGSQIGIFNGVGTDANTPMTRNQVAQMALNALRSEMVDFTGTPGIEVNGVKVGYRAEYTPRTSTEAKYNAIEDRTSDVASDLNHKGQYYIQLGEQLYNGKLRLDDATDDFGRPSRYWEYDGKEIGTYMKKELLDKEWHVEVTGKDLYDQLGKSTIEDKTYDFFIYVDGEDRYNATDGTSGVSTVFNRTQMNKNNKAGVGGTGNGTLTQVFVDPDEHEVTIAVINTYLARAKADYNEKRDEASFNVYAIKKGTTNSATYFWKALDRDNDQKETVTISGEDFDVANVKENDSFLVTVANGEIQSMAAPEVISAATLDSFKRNDNVVAEGTTYKYTTTAQYDVEVLDDYTGDSNYGVNLKDKHYNIYLDAYGNLIGIDLVENADNYVFITGVDSKSSNLSAKQYDANAIFLDGTMKTITFDNEKSTIQLQGKDNALLNTWCTYTVSGANEIYTLKEVQNPATTSATVDGTSVGVGDSYVGLKNGTAKAIKVGQYHDLMNNVNANSSVTNEINVKRVSLRGAVGASRNEYKYVYGNDATVYLNTEVKGIYTSGSNQQPRGVISKVTSVTTGIKNASLEVMTEAQAKDQAQRKSASHSVEPAANGTAFGAYVLYNDKGYVIAAVTVADDSAASENLVYVHTSSVDKESYDSTADEWTWTRRVAHNGEETTLTEVSDSISILKGMKQHNWYVVSYNAKGEVISANHALDELADKTGTKYNSNINTLETTVNNPGTTTVLYEKSSYNGLTAAAPNGCPDNAGAPHAFNAYRNDYGPKLENNTFFDITTATTGFYVNDDVKVVFIQKVKNVWETEFKSGKTDLENVIDALIKDETDNNGDYYYEVSAVLTNGRADVVVIRDLHTHGDSGNHNQVDTGKFIVDLTTPASVTVKHTGGAPATDAEKEEALTAVIAAIEKAGYKITKTTFASGAYTFKVTKTVGNTEIEQPDFVWNASSGYVAQINVTVNGVSQRINSSLSTTAAIASAAGVTEVGTYVNIYDKSAGTTTMTAAGAFTPGEGDTFDFGYYKIDVTESVSGTPTNKGSATLKAYLKGKTASDVMYAKKGNVSVDLDLKNTDTTNATTGKLTVTADTATVTSGATQDVIAKSTTVPVTVSVPVTNNNVTVTLTVADYVATVAVKVNYKGTTYTANVPEDTNSWTTVLTAAGINDLSAMSTYIRRDSDWSVGELASSSTIASGFKTGGKLVNNTAVTLGAVKMKNIATGEGKVGGTGATNVWKLSDTAKTTMTQGTDYYMVEGETIEVTVTGDTATPTAIANGNAFKVYVDGLTNSSVTGTKTTDFVLKATAGTAKTSATSWSATDKAFTLSNTAATDTVEGGKVVFTITVGSAGDEGMVVKIANPS